MWCRETSQWWDQCEPCAETWDASCAGTGGIKDTVVPAPATTTTLIMPTPAPTFAPTSAPTFAPVPVATPSPTASCAKVKYAQCGGPGFTGDACCPPGMWCRETSQWWDQCEPCAEIWDASCAGAVSLDQPPSLVQVQRKSSAPWLPADPAWHEEPARAFLAPKRHGILVNTD